MKKFKKHFIAFMLAMVLIISPAMQSFAAEELPTEAVYDMEKGGTQTFTIRDTDGSIDTVTIREVSNGNSRLANGSYEVGYDNTGVWIASFTVDVSSNKIYNAHSPRISVWGGQIKYPGITRPSTTHAILAFIYKFDLINYSTGVDVKIINGNFVITKR